MSFKKTPNPHALKQAHSDPGILHALLIIAFLTGRIYILTWQLFSVAVFQAMISWASHHHLTPGAGTRLAERFVMNLPSVGMAVLWQTEGSLNTASGCPKPPEFRELCKTSSEQYFSDNFFHCAASRGCGISWAFPAPGCLQGDYFLPWTGQFNFRVTLSRWLPYHCLAVCASWVQGARCLCTLRGLSHWRQQGTPTDHLFLGWGISANTVTTSA